MRRLRPFFLVGSSPLARGLQYRYVHPSFLGRIIPARAGFTEELGRRFRTDQDHPRSRGVYVVSPSNPRPAAGSSPLARGLHPEQNNHFNMLRIIPARAGFTYGKQTGNKPSSDHPRSRGVYWGGQAGIVALEGSSPLARGLRARWIWCPCTPTDHPRSRGVYLSVLRGRRRVLGIIPARAGFTPSGIKKIRLNMDHPRSRGVYLPPKGSTVCRMGSSPLARGLRPESPDRPAAFRIIPARAGFTRLTLSLLGGEWDHPRSRGVYERLQTSVPDGEGSSPLARGLRPHSLVESEASGIIPARAGFTLGDRRDSNGGPPYQGAFAFTGDLGTARLSCGSVVAGQRSTTTPSPV